MGSRLPLDKEGFDRIKSVLNNGMDVSEVVELTERSRSTILAIKRHPDYDTYKEKQKEQLAKSYAMTDRAPSGSRYRYAERQANALERIADAIEKLVEEKQ